jgi:hypothetical protein
MHRQPEGSAGRLVPQGSTQPSSRHGLRYPPGRGPWPVALDRRPMPVPSGSKSPANSESSTWKLRRGRSALGRCPTGRTWASTAPNGHNRQTNRRSPASSSRPSALPCLAGRSGRWTRRTGVPKRRRADRTGSCRALQRLIDDAVVAEDGPHPTVEEQARGAAVCQDHAHRPCHPRAISSGHERYPAVSHGHFEEAVGLAAQL